MIVLKPKRAEYRKSANLGRFFMKAVMGYRAMNRNYSQPAQFAYPPAGYQGFYPPDYRLPEVIVKDIKLDTTGIEKESMMKGIPIISETGFRSFMADSDYNLKDTNISYDLIKSGTKVFASVNIRWSEADSSLVYIVTEPKLEQYEKNILNQLKTILIEKLDIDFTTLRKEEAKGYLKKRFEEMLNTVAPSMTEERKEVFLYYIERDFIGLGKLEPLMRDPNLEDVSCDGIMVPMYIYHRNPLIGSVKTNIYFESKEELDIFVNKLAQRTGKSISVAQPLIGGTLPDGSRIQVTLGTDIARKGSNFTIRKFTKVPLTPVNLLNMKTIDATIGAYLWLAIEYGRSMLITGGVATGKTTLLNAMSLFIKPELKIVSIEDTAELVLPHPHWVPGVARLPMSEIGGKKVGEVDLFDLLRESLRQRPDYLIVGEVRGKEAYVLFQQIATGHSSLSTIHADSVERLMDRLTTPPISLPASLMESLDIIIFVVRIKYGSSYVRRIKSIYEVYGFDREKNFPLVNEVFKWNPIKDVYEAINPSMVLKRISTQYGIKENILQQEISRRMKMLNWMVKRNITDYRDVAKIAKLYYTRPEELLESHPSVDLMNTWKTLRELSFKFFKNSLDPVVDYFDSIKSDLLKADIGLSLVEYVYVMFFSVFAFFVLEFPIITVITSLLLKDFVLALLFSFTLNIVIALMVFFFFYTYPSILSGKRKKDIETALPFATTYMATIANSGAPPITMFKVISQFGEYGEVSKETEKIYRDVEVFGMDIVGAIRKTANRTPSDELKELLWGMDNVITSGGNVGDFLHEKSRGFISEYSRRLQQYSKTLSVLIEVYLTLILVGSVFFVIITALMGLLGGGGGMGNYLSFIQFLVIFIVMPFVSLGFIMLIRTISPTM